LNTKYKEEGRGGREGEREIDIEREREEKKPELALRHVGFL